MTSAFPRVVNKHAPLKQKVLRTNDAPVMIKDFRKTIYTRYWFKNNFSKNSTTNDERFYKKKQRNRRKCTGNYFCNISRKGIPTNTEFGKH